MDELLVSRDSSVSPSQLLSAIADETREWRESVIPDALRAEGVLRVHGKVDGARFEWSFHGGEPRGGSVRLRGTVLGTPSGSLVKARVARAYTIWPVVAFMSGLALLNVLTSHVSSAIPFLGIAGVLALIGWTQVGVIPDWTRSRAEYLRDRLYHAIAAAETAASSPSSRPANER